MHSITGNNRFRYLGAVSLNAHEGLDLIPIITSNRNELRSTFSNVCSKSESKQQGRLNNLSLLRNTSWHEEMVHTK